MKAGLFSYPSRRRNRLSTGTIVIGLMVCLVAYVVLTTLSFAPSIFNAPIEIVETING